MNLVEFPFDAVPVLVGKQLIIKRNRDRVLLTDITHVRGARDHDSLRLDGGPADRLPALFGHFAVGLLHHAEFHIRQPARRGADVVVSKIREQHAEGREVPGRQRDDDGLHADLAGDLGGVQGPGAAIGHHGEARRVQPPLGGDALDRIGHGRRRNPENTFGGLRNIKAERLGNLRRNGPFGGFPVQFHLAAQEAVRVQTAQHKIGVRHRRPVSAEAVTGRAGVRAGAFRPHVKGAGLVQKGEAAAAGADLEDIHHGDLNGQSLLVTAYQRVADGQHLAVMDHAGLGGGAPHIEGNRVLEAENMAKGARSDDPRRRARLQHPDAFGTGLPGFKKAAGGLDHEEGAIEAACPDVAVDPVHIAAHRGSDVGIGRHGGAAFILPVFLGQFVGDRDEDPREFLFQYFARPDFVDGISIGVQKQDGDAFDAVESLGEPPKRRLVQGRADLALGVHALRHFETFGPLDQRHVFLEIKVIGVRPVDPADFIDVAEPLGDDQRRIGAGALQDRVDGDGGAVEEQRGIGVFEARLGDAAADAVDEGGWGRQGFSPGKPARSFVERGDIGKRAAYVCSNSYSAA